MTNDESDSTETPSGVEPIAIIGMAARVPGAMDVDQFWRNLVDGVESITFFTEAELRAIGVTDSELANPNFVPAWPVLDQADHFDAGLFGVSDREAEIANPQNRLFLEVSNTALEDAGYDPGAYPGSVGVYAGTGADYYQWMNVRRNAKLWSQVDGNLLVSNWNFPDYVSTMVSYKLNLRGPSLTLHTACSSSMVSVHLAVEALRHGECDMALGGGACVELPLAGGYLGMEGFTSTDGHCRPFDARADGTVWSSGVGVVVLKRLSDAIADGDHVRSVIIGNAINNDGSDKIGFGAPSVRGQVECVAQALALADIDPRTVGYVEAHGTGTVLGDPIEVTALSTAYGHRADDKQWCGLGSVKSNIGHLSQAAGVVGLIKATLALEHRMIPPTINFEAINPAIDLCDSPFYVTSTLSKWEANGTPRRAGVSSFGFGGTNAHMILQEAPASGAVHPISDHPAHLLRLSAHTGAALAETVERLAIHLDHHPDIDLADVAHTLRVGRTPRKHRAFAVGADPESAVEALRDSKLHTGDGTRPAPRVAFLFTGQGGQYAGMGAELYSAEPVFASTVDKCAAILEPELGLDIRTLMFEARSSELGETRYTQPALFVLEYALATLWRDRGVEPSAMIGHSIGEYVAATVAGVFALPDALRLVAARGRLMQAMPAGSMLAVQLDESGIGDRLSGTGCTVATVNAPGACVIAGPSDAVDAIAEDLAAQGISIRKLRTSHAFHSPMMDPILDEFTATVAAVPRNAPRLKFLSNVTGQWITDAQATDPAYWAAHLRQPVRFAECVGTLLEDDGDLAVLECGPGRTLAGLVRRWLPREAVPPLHSLPGPNDRAGDVATLYGAAGQLWVAGVEVGAFGPPARRIPLPTYPYQRKRYWVEPDSADTAPVAPAATGPLPLDRWFSVPTWQQLPPPSAPATFGFDDGCWVFTAGERGAALAEAIRADGVPVTELRPEQMTTGEDYEALVDAGVPSRIVHAWALDAEPAADIESLWQALELGFFGLIRVVKTIAARSAMSSDIHLDIVSAGTQDVLGSDLTRPEQATVDGVAQVVPLELAGMSVRRIDAHPGETTTEQLLAELRAGADAKLVDSWRTIALRSGRRWSVEYRPVPVPAAPAWPRARGRYLVTGGLGGVGLSIAEDLAAQCQARLVLMSRSGLPSRSTWDTELAVRGTGDHIGRAIEAVRRMERAGARVLVVAADVTDPAALRRVRDQALAEFGGLDGIIHAAGLPGGGVVELQTRVQVTKVLAPKLAGTFALREAFGDLAMDFVALYSSVAAIGGGFGQVDYTAANVFLDAYARSDHGWPCRVVSINWGAWSEVGMAVEGLDAAAARDAMRDATTVAVDHPVLHSRDSTSCWGVITTETLLDEQRTMPSTGHLELIRAAVTEFLPAPDSAPVLELTEVVLLEPLTVPVGAAAEYRVRFADVGPTSTSFTVTSLRDGVRREHVRGAAAWVAEATPGRTDLDAIRTGVPGSTPRPADRIDPPFGIRPSDGAEAFRRVLAAGLGPQIVINSQPLADMLAYNRRSLADRAAWQAPGDAGSPVLEPDSSDTVEPGSALEARLSVIWAETIGVERVRVDDDFFELGGNSLIAVQLIARASQEAGIRLPMGTLFDAPTVSGFAARIERLKAAAKPAAAPEQGIKRLAREQ